jgi:hypothetical protein
MLDPKKKTVCVKFDVFFVYHAVYEQDCTFICFSGSRTIVEIVDPSPSTTTTLLLLRFQTLRNILHFDTREFVCSSPSSVDVQLFNDDEDSQHSSSSMYCCFSDNVSMILQDQRSSSNGKKQQGQNPTQENVPIKHMMDSLHNTFFVKPAYISSLLYGMKLVHFMQSHPHTSLRGNKEAIIPYQICITRDTSIVCEKDSTSPFINITPTDLFLVTSLHHPLHITMSNLQVYNISPSSAHRYFVKIPAHCSHNIQPSSVINASATQSASSIVCDSCHFTTDLGRCTQVYVHLSLYPSAFNTQS